MYSKTPAGDVLCASMQNLSRPHMKLLFCAVSCTHFHPLKQKDNLIIKNVVCVSIWLHILIERFYLEQIARNRNIEWRLCRKEPLHRLSSSLWTKNTFESSLVPRWFLILCMDHPKVQTVPFTNSSHEWTRLCSYFLFTLSVFLVAACIVKYVNYFINNKNYQF